jgi:hypothetical protein
VDLGVKSLDFVSDYVKMDLPPLGSLKAAANIASKDETFEIRDIAASLDGQNIKANVTGSVGDVLKVRGVDTTVALDVQSLDFVSNYIDVKLPPLGPLKASAGIASKGDTFEVRDIQVKLVGEQIHADVTGSVGDLIKLKAVDANVDVGLESLAALSEIAKTELPALGPLNASVNIASKGDTFEVKTLKADLSDEKIKARVAASVADLMKLAGINADIDFSVDTLATLGPLVKQDLPASGPVTLEGNISSQQGVKGPTEFDTVLKSDGFTASLKGRVAEPLAVKGIDVSLDVEAESMQKVGLLTGTEFASQEPMNLTANFKANDNSYELSGLYLKTGQLDVKGKAAFEQASESRDRPRLSASLHVSDLDLSQRQKARLEKAEEKVEAIEPEKETVEEVEEAPKKKLFPSEPLPWDFLRKVDVDIEATVESLTTLQLNLEDMIARVSLDNGLLKLSPLKANVGAGTFQGIASLDARRSPAALMADIELADATFRDFGGKVHFLVDLKGKGDSIAEIMAGLDGQLEVDVRDVILKKSLMTGFGSGLLNSINPFAKKEENTELICAILLFDIEDGIAYANKRIAAQMKDVTWFGSGEINLKTEEIDFGMSPKSRKVLDVGLGSLTKLAHVGGTLAHPKIELDPKDAAVKYGKYTAAVATGGLTFVGDLLFSKIRANRDVCTAILEDLEEIQEADEKAKKERSE